MQPFSGMRSVTVSDPDGVLQFTKALHANLLGRPCLDKA